MRRQSQVVALMLAQGATEQGATLESIASAFPDLNRRSISRQLGRVLRYTARWREEGLRKHYFDNPAAAKAFALADPWCRVNFHKGIGGATIVLGRRQLVLTDLHVEKLAREFAGHVGPARST